MGGEAEVTGTERNANDGAFKKMKGAETEVKRKEVKGHAGHAGKTCRARCPVAGCVASACKYAKLYMCLNICVCIEVHKCTLSCKGHTRHHSRIHQNRFTALNSFRCVGTALGLVGLSPVRSRPGQISRRKAARCKDTAQRRGQGLTGITISFLSMSVSSSLATHLCKSCALSPSARHSRKLCFYLFPHLQESHKSIGIH